MEANYYLDKRKMRADGSYSIKIILRHNNESTSISTGYACMEAEYVGDKPNKSGKIEVVNKSVRNANTINEMVSALLSKANIAKLELTATGVIDEMSVTEIRDYILGKKKKGATNLLKDVWKEYTDGIQAKKTLDAYTYAYKKLAAYLEDDLEIATLQNIDISFCKKFDNWMKKYGVGDSSRSIVFRNIRTIFNYAISCKYVSAEAYPFGSRGFGMPKSNKALRIASNDELNVLYNVDLPEDEMKSVARDVFFISLFSGGINPIDLYNMKPNLKEMVYVREKIKRANPYPVRIRITPQLQYYIDKYKGTDGKHMFNFAQRVHTYPSFYAKIRQEWKRLVTKLGFPDLTLYGARYTWATLAASKNCKVDTLTIDMTLGHIPNGMAAEYYIKFDWDNVADAQEKVENYLKRKVLK